MKEVINPGTAVAGPYSPGIRSGNTLYISGHGWPQTSSDISEQTYQTLDSIKRIIINAGGEVSDIVNTTVFLRNMADFNRMNNAYKNFFEQNNVTKAFPTRTTVEVSNLPLPEMLIEINAVAVLK
jgi:2-iminobutanoate/2-iminopropanoate deaminase